MNFVCWQADEQGAVPLQHRPRLQVAGAGRGIGRYQQEKLALKSPNVYIKRSASWFWELISSIYYFVRMDLRTVKSQSTWGLDSHYFPAQWL